MMTTDAVAGQGHGSADQPGVIAGERSRSSEAIRAQARRAASGFAALGVADGDCVALLLRNDFAFFEASLGAGLAGAYAVPINWHSTADEVGYILADCGAKVLVVHRDLLPATVGVLSAGATLLVVETPAEIAAAYRSRTDLPLPLGALDWGTWIAAQTPIAQPVTTPRAAVIYTSGTTGKPKGVRRAPQTGDYRTQAAAIGYGFAEPGPRVVLMNGPMYHSAPNGYARIAFATGASFILQARFDAEEMLALIERHRVTHMHVVPTMFIRLLRLPAAVKRRYDLSSLRNAIHGASPCPVDIKRQMIEWWGPVIHEYYGSTETGLVTAHGSQEALLKPGTVGRPLPGVQVRILGERGELLGLNVVGDIYVRPSVPDFTYIGRDAERAQVESEGFVTVGDVGLIDDDGYLFLRDRRRDMIISGGVNIYPAEIEAALHGIPGVQDCAVFGIPDAEFGEAVCAYIQPVAGVTLDADALKRALGATLSRFKVPKVIELVDSLPREDSGKIFKRRIRDPYWPAGDTAPASGELEPSAT